jgi:hypothetical protein
MLLPASGQRNGLAAQVRVIFHTMHSLLCSWPSAFLTAPLTHGLPTRSCSAQVEQAVKQRTVTLACACSRLHGLTRLHCGPTAQVPAGVQVDAAGWVSTQIRSLGEITLGSPTGRSIAGTVQGLWVLPGAVAFDGLATAGQTVADVLTAITAPGSATAAGPTVSLQVQTAAPVVGTPVSVAVSVTAAAGRTVQARVTFYGAAPRCASSCQLGLMTWSVGCIARMQKCKMTSPYWQFCVSVS